MKEQIILGSLCGDGHIELRYKKPIYKETHSIKQKEYALWKAKEIGLKYRIRLHSQKKPIPEIEIFKSDMDFLEYHKLFYTPHKRFSKRVLDLLQPEGIAVWYCDDGCYTYTNGCFISLGKCPSDDCLLIQDFFFNLGIISRIQKDIKVVQGEQRVYHKLCFNKAETNKLMKLIKDFVPACMSYKLGVADKAKEMQFNANRLSKLSYYRTRDKRLAYRKWYRENRSDKVKESKHRSYLKKKAEREGLI